MIKEGTKVYPIINRSNHPFRIGEAIWVRYVSSGIVLCCENYFKTRHGYLYMDEVSTKKPLVCQMKY